MNSESLLWIVFWVCLFSTFTYITKRAWDYDEKMAQHGYCQVVLTPPGGHTRTVWEKCK